MKRTQISILLCALIFIACKKDEQEVEVLCKSSIADSSFIIYQPLGPSENERWFETDTIGASNDLIHFFAVDSTADEYSWQFSGDPRVFYGRQVRLRFLSEEEVLITLTQKRFPANYCYNILPNEKTYTKKLVVVPLAETPIYGKYFGHNASDTTIKFTIEILRNGLTNLPNGSQYDHRNEIYYASNAIYIGGVGTYDPDYGAYATEGYAYLQDRNSRIQVNYSYKTPASGGTHIKDTFYGIKIR